MKRLILLLLLICSPAWAGRYQQIDALWCGIIGTDGSQLAGGKVYFYLPGTTKLTTVYQDSNGTASHTNPVTLDVNGRALVFANRTVRVRIVNSDGVLIADYDNLIYGSGSIGDYSNEIRETHTATVGQTVATLVNPYVVGANSLTVYVDGIRQNSGDYSETSTTKVTFTTAFKTASKVEFVIKSEYSEIRSLFTGISGQTLFSLTNPYTMNDNSMSVYIDGVKQNLTDYTETSTTTVTLSTALTTGSTVEFVQKD